MSRLEANLRWLTASDTEAAGQLRRAGGGRLTVVQARSGHPTATVQNRWVHSAYDPVEEGRAWAEAQCRTWQPDETAVVLGVGLLYHVEALRKAAPREARIVVVVPDVEEWRDACEAREWGAWVSDVRWMVGPVPSVARDLGALGGSLRLLSYTPAAGLHPAYHHALETAVRDELAARVGGRLHVAVVGPIYGGSLPIAGYVVSALEQLGHRVTWVDHSLHQSSYEALGRIQGRRHQQILQGNFAELLGQYTMVRLAEDPPDLLLALAQAPMTLAVLQQLRKKQFLTAMWFVENYRHLTYWQQLAAGYDYWFVIQRGACVDALRSAGAPQVSYLPMAADPAVHRRLELTEADRCEFGSDVSFVGAGYANRRGLFPPLMTSEWSLKIWGNEWDGADALRPVLQRGGARIDTETCMKVFNASTINLNLHSHTGAGFDPQGDFVNPRAFELAACRAFQLVDQRSLLPELFSDEEMAIVARPDDLPPAIRRWLHDAAAREAVCEAAHRRTLKEHTYAHRMRTLLAQVGMGCPDRVGALLRGERHVDRLVARSGRCPELVPLLRASAHQQRVELKDVAAEIRKRGANATLRQEELLILMLDEYRSETRDVA